MLAFRREEMGFDLYDRALSLWARLEEIQPGVYASFAPEDPTDPVPENFDRLNEFLLDLSGRGRLRVHLNPFKVYSKGLGETEEPGAIRLRRDNEVEELEALLNGC